jgi:uncharacterized protein YndB with AHSA1/START domain
MARVQSTTHVEAPAERVFAVLSDWQAQPLWMRDARSVEVRGDARTGVGVRLRRRTDILAGIVVNDDMVTTAWTDDRLIAVRHTGRIIGGVGAFELTPTAYGTRIEWWEEIDPPLGPLGEAVATLAVPWFTRVFRASLAGLKRVCESTSVRP